jgi:hypothetical protein
MAGILSVFHVAWQNKKINYMNYFKQKSSFWPTIASTLKLIKKELDENKRTNLAINTSSIDFQPNFDLNDTIEYENYFDIIDKNFDGEEFSQGFDEFILESNVKSVSYAFKIFSIELFEVIYLKKSYQAYKDIQMFLSENIFGKSLIEKWLDFYAFQLRRDLSNETQSILSLIRNGNLTHDQSQHINPNMSIMDVNTLNAKLNRNSRQNNTDARKLKSKNLLDSINTLLLLLNKTSRITSTIVAASKSSPQDDQKSKLTLLNDQINMRKLNLKSVTNSLIASMSEIISHFLYLNNISVQYQQELKQHLQQQQDGQNRNEQQNIFEKSSFIIKKSNKTMDQNSYLTLKQTNEVVKQFHSISNTLMVIITSIKAK